MTTAKKPKFSRILLKLSGEALGGESGLGISPEAVQHMAVPEPTTGSFMLLAAGLAGFMALRRRKVVRP